MSIFEVVEKLCYSRDALWTEEGIIQGDLEQELDGTHSWRCLVL